MVVEEEDCYSVHNTHMDENSNLLECHKLRMRADWSFDLKVEEYGEGSTNHKSVKEVEEEAEELNRNSQAVCSYTHSSFDAVVVGNDLQYWLNY
jgi:hypothetical protein